MLALALTVSSRARMNNVVFLIMAIVYLVYIQCVDYGGYGFSVSRAARAVG